MLHAPWVSVLQLPRFGTIEATPEHARAALALGAAVLVYPGGDWETHRPSWHRGRIEFGGREGFVRLALETQVPVVPVVSVGGQETALFLSRGERMSHALALDRRYRLKVFPISLALPWGMDVGDLFGHIPLPAKITTQVLDPIDLHERFGRHADVDAMYTEITGLMQATLDRLSARRRLPVIG